MKQILFSCVGTTDPVRGEHDGPMLHIVRHYRPETVCLFLTKEIRELANTDDRFAKTEAWISRHWDGYSPEFQYIDSGVVNAHDMDELDGPLYAVLDQLSSRYPEAEILINVTSGTPQMQMLLSQMAMDTRYRCRGIQVANYERKSGTSDRANRKDYDVELELECNEDELPEAENRCTEPSMYAIRREHQRQQITALLRQRDFDAAAEMESAIPQSLMPLVRHLAARKRLDFADAKRKAADCRSLPFSLYPYKTGDREEYGRVSEYYLLMKNLAASGHYSEFLLHMEPMTLHLQMAMLNLLLRPRHISCSAFIQTDYRGRLMLVPEALRASAPELYRHYEAEMLLKGWTPEEREVSTYACDMLLSFYPSLPAVAGSLFSQYDSLKKLRNRLAHELSSVTDEEIADGCGAGTARLCEEMEKVILDCFTACDPAVFSVYEKSIAYIEEHL